MYRKTKAVSLIAIPLLLALTPPALSQGKGPGGGAGKKVENNKPNPDLENLTPKELADKGREPQNDGLKLKRKADSLRKQGQVAEADKLMKQAQVKFIEATRIYGFIAKRFPNDPIAPVAGITAAQNLLRADQFEKAFDIFMIIADNKDYDPGKIRAQALFWSGTCKERMAKSDKKKEKALLKDAYNIYDRLRMDYPTTKWAKYARGRLADRLFQDLN